MSQLIRADKQKFYSSFKTHLGLISTHKNRAAIFGLTNLKVGGAFSGLDKISFWVDQEQSWWITSNLTTNNKRGVKWRFTTLSCVGGICNNFSQCLADDPRHLEH